MQLEAAYSAPSILSLTFLPVMDQELTRLFSNTQTLSPDIMTNVYVMPKCTSRALHELYLGSLLKKIQECCARNVATKTQGQNIYNGSTRSLMVESGWGYVTFWQRSESIIRTHPHRSEIKSDCSKENANNPIFHSFTKYKLSFPSSLVSESKNVKKTIKRKIISMRRYTGRLVSLTHSQ